MLGPTRLSRQGIAPTRAQSPAEVVSWLGALQAQDLPGAKWSVGLRSPGATEADVDAAFDRGEIVRTWPQRGTLHLVPARDAAWRLSLSTPRIIAGAARRRQSLELDLDVLARAGDVVRAFLAGGRAASRDDVLAALTACGVSTEKQRGYHILWHLSQTGVTCMGPMLGRNDQAFVLLDEWVPNPRRLERDEALGELVRRYFESHGPATLKDVGWWSGLTAREVKTGVAVAGDSLARLRIEGRECLLAADAELCSAQALETGVQALPGFDEYLLGYQDRSAVLPAEHADAICPGGNGVFLSTIVVDAHVVGTWRKAVKAKSVVFETKCFTPLTPDQRRGFEAAAAAHARFLGLERATEVRG